MLDKFKDVGNYLNAEVYPDAQLEIGKDVVLRCFISLYVASGARLKLGDRVFFNDHCTIRCNNLIEVGNDTMFGDGVRIFDHNHLYSNYHIEKIRYDSKPIKIGRDCWIGANSVILNGVTIGDNVIIGAGSVIYKDIPSNSIVISKEDLIIKERPQSKYHVFTLTASDTLEQLTYLVENLPEVTFHIAARTNVSDYLDSFTRYENVSLRTNVHHDEILDDLMEKADLYLDINHWGEVDSILDLAIKKETPIFAFENVAHRPELATEVFSPSEPEKMVTAVRTYLTNVDKKSPN